MLGHNRRAEMLSDLLLNDILLSDLLVSDPFIINWIVLIIMKQPLCEHNL